LRHGVYFIIDLMCSLHSSEIITTKVQNSTFSIYHWSSSAEFEITEYY